jgi:O-antigen/teichoic acid export membrane protein
MIWLSYEDAVRVFNLKPAYLDSVWVFFFVGLAKIVDLGTGVNSQIINTSVHWRFEFVSGMILLTLAIPLNYFLVKEFGIIGAAYAHLISFSVYNAIRIIFLKRKFNMQPFSIKTAYAIMLAFTAYAICYYSFSNLHDFMGILIKSIVFLVLYGGSVIYFNLSPDVLPVWKIIQTKTGIKKGDQK